MLEAERAVFGAENFGAGDVAGQQVRGELDAVEIAFNAPGQVLDRLGLGEPRRAFDEQVAVGEQGQ